MKKQNDDLQELMALLPSNIKNTKEFTTKTKMVIAQLILMNGLDKVKNDGYFFITNQALVTELGITEKTLIKIMRNLEVYNFITRKAGKRGEASEYIVNEEIIKSFGNTVKKHCNTTKENTVINYSNKINDLILIINDLVKSNNELITRINNLEITVLNYSKNIQNYSTDTESDTDIEIDININNIYNNINKKEEYIIEEIEVIETSISDNESKKNDVTNIDTKCNTTIDKEESKENIEEVGLIENPTSNKSKEENIPMTNGNGSDDEDEVLDMIFGEEEIIEENNTAFQLQYVGMQTKEEESMTEKFEKNLNTLLDKLNQCTSIQDLEDKVVKLCGWVERCSTSYTEEELETIKDRISDNYIANQTRIEKTEKIQVSMEEDFFNSVMLDSNAKTVNQVKKEKEEETTQAQNTITKEELENNINDFINSLPTYDDISMITTIANYITKKYDKAIREYGLMQLAMDMYTQIDAHKSTITSDLTDFNSQDIETNIDDEKAQEIASCEVTEATSIDDCISILLEGLEPAVFDDKITYSFDESTRW